jgi:two-component system, chemotaxis family, chemotaxis protein CheY
MLHCLVIDDSDIIRRYTRLIFETLGFRVSDADSAVAARERLAVESPDYILVDWRLPDSNSLRLVKSIRQMQLSTRPYIIYVVTENDQIEIQSARAFGADTHLLKPYNRQIVEQKLVEIRQAAA